MMQSSMAESDSVELAHVFCSDAVCIVERSKHSHGFRMILSSKLSCAPEKIKQRP